MTAKILALASAALCALSVYFNRRNEVWADRCLFAAYTALIYGVIFLWK